MDEVNTFDNQKVYNPFEEMVFTYDRCFLCGARLTDESESVEHIFPKWLQRKYNLWSKKLNLLNGSVIPYKQLTIPCCKKCNGEYLSEIERIIQIEVEKGYDCFKKIDKKIIFQWLTKLSYGMLFKELSLLIDRRNTDLGTIMTPDYLEKFNIMFTLLQTVRYETEFINKPWSIFIFNLHKFNDENDYDAQDYISAQNYFMRLGEIGIIAILQDNGHQENNYAEYFAQYQDIKLHPIQFYEICAKVLYKSSLLLRTPKYIFTLPQCDSDKMIVISQPLEGMSTAPIYDVWNQEEYARILEHFWKPWKIQFNELYVGNDLTLSFLNDENGNVKVFESIDSI